VTLLADPSAAAEARGAAPARAHPDPWPEVALAALLWVAAYNVVEPLSRWISHGLNGMPRGSRSGEAEAFFF
jgi:hypothetical protein